MKAVVKEIAIWVVLVALCGIIGGGVCKIVTLAIEQSTAIGCFEYHNQEACEEVIK